MSWRQTILTCLALIVLAAVAAWAPVWFVESKIGGPPPCEVSNTCHHWK